MAVFYVARPIEFGVFPTVLLLATLLRLALNVASTRVVLLHGHTGTHAAGQVIESFGEFVIGGNFAVGVVVFVILTIINFVVVTKGSGRISEVSARFTLDAMPGKQMAIDADLNAGLITQDEARARRAEVRAEADFYGSMDGASKFVRGDAIAGILILFINIIGGLAIGMIAHDLPFATAGRTYTLLTIGDGLVTQIPALLLSTAVAIIVTRMSGAQDMSGEMGRQLFRQPKALGVAAGLLGVMGLIPGMPNLAFLTMAALAGYGAYVHQEAPRRRERPPKRRGRSRRAAARPPEARELSWEDVQPVDLLGLEVGYRLVPLVNKNAERRSARAHPRRAPQAFAGSRLPRARGAHPRQPRSQPEQLPHQSRRRAGRRRQVYPEREMAINPGRVFGQLKGIATRDPAFGMEAVWIEPSTREHAQTLGYTVVDASTVVATHLSHIVQTACARAARPRGSAAPAQHAREERAEARRRPRAARAAALLRRARAAGPARRARADPQHPHDRRNARGACAAHAGPGRCCRTRCASRSAARSCRTSPASRASCRSSRSSRTWSALLQSSLGEHGQSDASPGLEPGLAERLQQRLAESAQRQELSGEPAVLLVPPQLRQTLARFMRASVPSMHVLAWNEIPDNRKVRLVTAVGRS